MEQTNPQARIGRESIFHKRHFDRLTESRGGWGSLRPALFDLSDRWKYWAYTLLNKQLPPSTMHYPKFDFVDHFDDRALPARMIRDCLLGQEHRFEDFLDYLLFLVGSFDVRELPKGITQEDIRYWRKVFDLKAFYDAPGDWFGNHYELHVVSRSTRSATGFFSTPMSICRLLVELSKPCFLDSLHEPCCGSGRMLLAASNSSIHLSGTDINPILCKIATLNAWLYMPSVVMPCKELTVQSEIKLDRKIMNTLKRKEPYDDRTDTPRILPKNCGDREPLHGFARPSGNQKFLPALPIHLPEKF